MNKNKTQIIFFFFIVLSKYLCSGIEGWIFSQSIPNRQNQMIIKLAIRSFISFKVFILLDILNKTNYFDRLWID